MTQAAVIVNPTKVDGDALGELEAALAAAGCRPRWWETTPADCGRGAAAEAVAAGVDLVVAVGGDGTVMACLCALAGTGIPLAVVPAGTGNLLARNLGLPRDLPGAVQVALHGADRKIDVGRLGDRCFAVMAGIGFDAAMLDDATEGAKRRLGWLAYVLSGLQHLRDRPVRATIRIDSGRPLRRRVRAVLIGNVGRLQGGLPLIPAAEPDDGLLDVMVLSPRTIRDWLRLAAHVLRRHPTDAPGLLERHRGKEITVRLRRPQPRELDGELIGWGTSLDVLVDPRAAVLRVPATLASGQAPAPGLQDHPAESITAGRPGETGERPCQRGR